MDAIDILGGLFGRKRGGSGKGPDLGDIFGRRKESAPGSSSRSQSPQDVDAQAKELEDILNVGRDRDAQRRSGQAPVPTKTSRQAPSFPAPSTPRQAPSPGSIRIERPAPLPQETSSRQNEQAVVLIRAMVNAAKVDGEISVDEQKSIFAQFEGGTDEAMAFLRQEVAQPLDVREFAWSVPLGMEQQVYAISLMAIDVDSKSEKDYLDVLSHALRLPTEVRGQLDQRFSAKARR